MSISYKELEQVDTCAIVTVASKIVSKDLICDIETLRYIIIRVVYSKQEDLVKNLLNVYPGDDYNFSSPVENGQSLLNACVLASLRTFAIYLVNSQKANLFFKDNAGKDAIQTIIDYGDYGLLKSFSPWIQTKYTVSQDEFYDVQDLLGEKFTNTFLEIEI